MSDSVDFGGPSSSQALPLLDQDESRQPPFKLLRRTVGVARAEPGGEVTSGETASLRPRQSKRPKSRNKQRQRHKNTPASPSHSPLTPATSSPPQALQLTSRPQPVPLPVHPTAAVPFPSHQSQQTAFTPQSLHPSPIVINLCTPSPSPPERDSVAPTVPAASSSTLGLDIRSTLNRETNPAVSQPEASISAGNSSQVLFPSHDLSQQQGRSPDAMQGSLDAMVPRSIVSVPQGAERQPPRPTHSYRLRQRSTQRASSAAMATGLHGNGHPYAPDLNPSQSGMRLSHYGNPLAAALGTWNPMVIPMRRTFHSVPTSSPPPPYTSRPGLDLGLVAGSSANPNTPSPPQLQTSTSPSSVPAPYFFSLTPSPTRGVSEAPTPATNILPPSPSPSDPSIAPFLPTLTSAPAVGIGGPIPASPSQPGSPYGTSFPTSQPDQSGPPRADPLRPPTLAVSLSPVPPSLSQGVMMRSYWSNVAARLDQNAAFIAAHSHSSGGGGRNGTGSSRQLRSGPVPRVPDPVTMATPSRTQQIPRAVPATSDGTVPIGSQWSDQVLGLLPRPVAPVRSSRSLHLPHLSSTSVSATNSQSTLSSLNPMSDNTVPAAGHNLAPSSPAHNSPGLNLSISYSTIATEHPSYSSHSSSGHIRGLSPSLATGSYEAAGSSSSRGGSSSLSSRQSREAAGSSARSSQQERWCGGPSTSALASGGPSRQLESEVIIVDDIDSDSDDDVIIGTVELGDEHRRRQLQISRDLVYARALQAQLDRETTQPPPPPPTSIASHPLSAHTAIPRGGLPSHPLPTAAVPSQPDARSSLFPSQQPDARSSLFPWVPIEEDSYPFDELELMPPPPRGSRRDTRRPSGPHHIPMPRPPSAAEGESSIIRDNFDALASRVNSWTAADARRILHVARLATPTNRRRPRSRRNMMGAVMELPPAIIYRAIMLGSPLRDGGSYEELLEIAERLGPARVQGLSKEVIDSLPVKDFSSAVGGETESCVVCMSEFEEKDKVRSLPCTHDFHQKCIDHWLKEHRTCPICRVEVRSSQ